MAQIETINYQNTMTKNFHDKKRTKKYPVHNNVNLS